MAKSKKRKARKAPETPLHTPQGEPSPEGGLKWDDHQADEELLDKLDLAKVPPMDSYDIGGEFLGDTTLDFSGRGDSYPCLMIKVVDLDVLSEDVYRTQSGELFQCVERLNGPALEALTYLAQRYTQYRKDNPPVGDCKYKANHLLLKEALRDIVVGYCRDWIPPTDVYRVGFSEIVPVSRVIQFFGHLLGGFNPLSHEVRGKGNFILAQISYYFCRIRLGLPDSTELWYYLDPFGAWLAACLQVYANQTDQVGGALHRWMFTVWPMWLEHAKRYGTTIPFPTIPQDLTYPVHQLKTVRLNKGARDEYKSAFYYTSEIAPVYRQQLKNYLKWYADNVDGNLPENRRY